MYVRMYGRTSKNVVVCINNLSGEFLVTSVGKPTLVVQNLEYVYAYEVYAILVVHEVDSFAVDVLPLTLQQLHFKHVPIFSIHLNDI